MRISSYLPLLVAPGPSLEPLVRVGQEPRRRRRIRRQPQQDEICARCAFWRILSRASFRIPMPEKILDLKASGNSVR